jgi:hypothetical protein
MREATARRWNEIAKRQPLATTWTKQVFPLTRNELDKALDYEDPPIQGTSVSRRVALPPRPW